MLTPTQRHGADTHTEADEDETWRVVEYSPLWMVTVEAPLHGGELAGCEWIENPAWRSRSGAEERQKFHIRAQADSAAAFTATASGEMHVRAFCSSGNPVTSPCVLNTSQHLRFWIKFASSKWLDCVSMRWLPASNQRPISSVCVLLLVLRLSWIFCFFKC